MYMNTNDTIKENQFINKQKKIYKQKPSIVSACYQQSYMVNSNMINSHGNVSVFHKSWVAEINTAVESNSANNTFELRSKELPPSDDTWD